MCKNRLHAFVAALTLTASPALAGPAEVPAPDYAAPLFDAYYNLGIGYGSNAFDLPFSTPTIRDKGATLQGRATFEAALGDRFGTQVDGVLRHEWNSQEMFGFTFDNPTTSETLAAHLFWRDPNVGLIGAIGQFTNHDARWEEGGFQISLTDQNYFAGLEGQYFLGNVTLYAQAAYRGSTLSSGSSSIDGDGVALAGQARYFINPDLLIAAKGTYDFVRYDIPGSSAPHFDIEGWTAALRGEYRPATMPVSFFGEFTYGEKTYKQSDSFFDVSEKDTRAMVGIQYNFGTKSLQERDRAGGSLDPFENHFSYPFFPI